MNGLVGNLARDAGVLEINAVNNAHRTRDDEIARDDTNGSIGHRRVGQALAERRLDIET